MANGLYEQFITSDNQSFNTSNNETFEVLDKGCVNIGLFYNQCEHERVYKTLTNFKAVYGYFRDEVDLVHPTIEIAYDGVFDYNYLQITQFKRFYFIDSIICVRTGLYRLTLTCDVVSTYYTQYGESIAFIERSGNLINERLIDKERVIEQGVDLQRTGITPPENIFVDGYITQSNFKDIPQFILNGYKLSVLVSE